MKRFKAAIRSNFLFAISAILLLSGIAALCVSAYRSHIYGPSHSYFGSHGFTNHGFPLGYKDDPQERRLWEQYKYGFIEYGDISEEIDQDITNRGYVLLLKNAVCYYTKTDEEYILDFIIPAGTEIYAEKPIEYYSSIYGLITYPTAEKGWRYAVPFQTVEAYESDAASVIYRYVKLDDLKPVAFELYKKNPFYKEYAKLTYNSQAWMKHAGMLFMVDIILYNSIETYQPDNAYYTGDYILPDFHPKIFNAPVIILLLSGVLVLFAGIVRRLYDIRSL